MQCRRDTVVPFAGVRREDQQPVHKGITYSTLSAALSLPKKRRGISRRRQPSCVIIENGPEDQEKTGTASAIKAYYFWTCCPKKRMREPS